MNQHLLFSRTHNCVRTKEESVLRLNEQLRRSIYSQAIQLHFPNPLSYSHGIKEILEAIEKKVVVSSLQVFSKVKTEIQTFCSMVLRHWVSGSRRFEGRSRLCLQPHTQRRRVISQTTSILEVDIAYFKA